MHPLRDDYYIRLRAGYIFPMAINYVGSTDRNHGGIVVFLKTSRRSNLLLSNLIVFVIGHLELQILQRSEDCSCSGEWEVSGRWVGGEWEVSGRWVGGEREVSGRWVGDEWEVSWRLVGGEWEVSGRWVGGEWEVSGRWVGGEREVSGRWVGGEWEVSGRWVGGEWEVSGRWVGGEWEVSARWVGGECEVSGRWVGGEWEVSGRWVGGEWEVYSAVFIQNSSMQRNWRRLVGNVDLGWPLCYQWYRHKQNVPMRNITKRLISKRK